jgi:protein ImuA
MQTTAEKRDIVKQLQAKIDAFQGMGKCPGKRAKSGFDPFDAAFPGHVFPIGTVHEFLSHEPADAAATNGFITALAGKVLGKGGMCLWIGQNPEVFPPGLRHFGPNS